jgi:Putative transposase
MLREKLTSSMRSYGRNATDEFIRRFLMHVLPAGFHRIRYYGLLASGKRAENIARARELRTLPKSAEPQREEARKKRRTWRPYPGFDTNQIPYSTPGL